MYAFTKVGHLVQLCIIFWPHFIIKILGRLGRPNFACRPISKYIFLWCEVFAIIIFIGSPEYSIVFDYETNIYIFLFLYKIKDILRAKGYGAV